MNESTNASNAFATRPAEEGVAWGVVYHRYRNIWRITRSIPLPTGDTNVDTFGEYATESEARAEAARLEAKR